MRDLHTIEVRDKTILSAAFQNRNQYKAVRAEACLIYIRSKKVVVNGMTPDEVIKKLEGLGKKISRSTLLNYEKLDLIPKAKRYGGGGRGKGRTTDYPNDTFAEAYAVIELMHGRYRMRPEHIANIRSVALQLESALFTMEQSLGFIKIHHTLTLHNLSLIYLWLINKAIAQFNIPSGKRFNLIIIGDKEKGIISKQIKVEEGHLGLIIFYNDSSGRVISLGAENGLQKYYYKYSIDDVLKEKFIEDHISDLDEYRRTDIENDNFIEINNSYNEPDDDL